MPYLPAWQDDLRARLIPNAVAVVARGQQLHPYPIWVNRDQLGDLSPAVGQDLAEGVTPQGQMPLQHFAPLEWVLVAVGPFAQQLVEPVVRHPVLAAVLAGPVDHQGERRHGLREDAHASVDRSQAHGRIGRDTHARDASSRDRLEIEIPPG